MKTLRSPRRVTRGNPLLQERIHDPYRSREKLREATRCPQCGVRYRNGRWAWPGKQTYALKAQLCPACRRINDRCPAGEISLSGKFVHAHRDEIVARVRHVEASESALHPLHRIMQIDENDARIVISTTDIHLPHQIAHALKDAWGGATRTHYDLDGYYIRVHWCRDQ